MQLWTWGSELAKCPTLCFNLSPSTGLINFPENVAKPKGMNLKVIQYATVCNIFAMKFYLAWLLE